MDSKTYPIGIMCSVLLLAALPLHANGQAGSIIGSWDGVLSVPGQSLRVVFHFASSDDGNLTGTLDSPDQGALGIPLGEIIRDNRQLHVVVPSIDASFEGTVTEAADRIVGVWSQVGQKWPLTLDPAMASVVEEDTAATEPAALDVDVAGTWSGTLRVGSASLRLVFHLTGNPPTGTMDSPDQGATGIPLGAVTGNGSLLRITVPAVAGTFEGELATSGERIDGTWSQGGRSIPLVLTSE